MGSDRWVRDIEVWDQLKERIKTAIITLRDSVNELEKLVSYIRDIIQ